ncbi:MAG: hypothetical protein K0Q74_700 [Gammaproteobacteria bacterium]|jgi:hypothetical protein|nr:hypothetical protein [Gammaproteobacteria bacterium]
MKTNYEIELIEDNRLNNVVGGKDGFPPTIPNDPGLYRLDQHGNVYVRMPNAAAENMPEHAIDAAGFLFIPK